MSKTIDEKRKALEEYCNRIDGCDDCIISKKKCAGEIPNTIKCYTDMPDEVINKHYEVVFGKDTEPTAQLELMQEDVDTIIKVKSNRKIDNISIYFKED